MENEKNFPISLLGEFTPVNHLGAGAFGSVWAVRRNSDQKSYAIKLFNRDLTADPLCLKRFERERELAARRLHKGIVDIYDAGEVNGSLYLVMELIEGKSLADILEESRPLDAVDSLQICLELANCLAALHRADFVHRDIKPDNIFIEPKGRPRLLDLGLARSLGGEKLTKTGVIIGSPFYMSPALCRGEKATSSDDVFALGMTLLQCLSSNNPAAAADSVVALMGERAAPNWKVAVPVTCGGAVTKLIRWLTAADPKNRPRDGKEAARAISEAMANLSSSAAIEATIKGEDKSAERTSKCRKTKEPMMVLSKEVSSREKSNLRQLFPLFFLLVVLVVGYKVFSAPASLNTKSGPSPAKQIKISEKRGPWPGIDLLEKVASKTDSAKNARNDWALKDAADDGIRFLQRLAKVDWCPGKMTGKELEDLVNIPRFFFIHIADKEVEQKNLAWIGQDKMPSDDDDERAVVRLWAALLAHNDRKGVPPLIAKWYSRGKKLPQLVKGAVKQTPLDYSLRNLSLMCSYMTFQKRQSQDGQNYLKEILERLKTNAVELRKLRIEGKQWANLLLLLTLYDEASLISLKEAQKVNDEANQQLDQIALEAETLAPRGLASGPINLETTLAIYCRDLAIRRPFNESAYRFGVMASRNMTKKIKEYQQLAFTMALVHMSRYDSPRFVRLVHLQYFKAEWLNEEHSKDIVEKYGKTVRNAFSRGLIKELPWRMK